MPTIYKSQITKEFFNPFGPPLGYLNVLKGLLNMNQLLMTKNL